MVDNMEHQTRSAAACSVQLTHLLLHPSPLPCQAPAPASPLPLHLHHLLHHLVLGFPHRLQALKPHLPLLLSPPLLPPILLHRLPLLHQLCLLFLLLLHHLCLLVVAHHLLRHLHLLLALLPLVRLPHPLVALLLPLVVGGLLALLPNLSQHQPVMHAVTCCAPSVKVRQQQTHQCKTDSYSGLKYDKVLEFSCTVTLSHLWNLSFALYFSISSEANMLYCTLFTLAHLFYSESYCLLLLLFITSM